MDERRLARLLEALREVSKPLRSDEVAARLVRAITALEGVTGAELALEPSDGERALREARGETRGAPARTHVMRVRGEPAAELRLFANAGFDALAFDALVAQAEAALANARVHAAALLRAERDALTGLANHGRIWESLEREATRAQRYGRALGFVLFDIDRFKSWNDRFGHLAGDEALVRIAALVRERSRASDTAGRYGGDELALVLPETTHEGAVAVAEKIRAAAEALARGEAGAGLTLSAGVASAPADGKTAGDLMRVADARLYRAKAANGNRVIA